jgi:CheY-like chemotaxis protein
MVKPFDKEYFIEKANDAIAKKRYNEISEEDRDLMVLAMAAGVCHQFGNRLNEFVFEHHDITEALDDAKILCLVDPDERILKIAYRLDNALRVAANFGENIKKSTSIIDSVSGYQNLISEKKEYCFMFLQNVIDIAAGLLKLNNKLEDAPVKTVNVVNKTFYGIKSVILEVIYGCMQNAYEAIEYRMKYSDVREIAANPPEIIVSYSETPQSHVIEIKDNGIGIDESAKKKIFAPFFTTKPSSTPGIGSSLFIMKKMIEDDHKGKLTVESEYRKGTTVKIEIPMEPGMKTVLVIDKEAETAGITAHIIRRKGFTAIVAKTWQEGIQKYKEVKPVCVFIDYQVNWVSEDVAIKKLLEIDPGAWVYILTDSSDVDESAAREMGAKGLIHKPATEGDIIEKIKHAAKERISR